MISIFLHLSDGKEMKLEVNPMDPVITIEPFYVSTKPSFLIYKNSVLLSRFSFDFFDIKENDHLYAVEVIPETEICEMNPNLDLMVRKRQIFRKKMHYNESIESMKLDDFHSLLQISNTFFLRKVEMSDIFLDRKRSRGSSSTIPDRPIAPSKEAIPSFW